MTLVNAETGEIVAELTPDGARSLTDQIRTAVGVTWELVKQAYEGRAWAALGYGSWDDYCSAEFGGARIKLPREERQEVVASLRDAGLSIRAIAAATGDSPMTVQRAVAGVPNGTPEPVFAADDDSGEPPAPVDLSGEPEPGHTPAPATITGTDGKQYAAAKPTQLRRSPLPDAAERAGWEFRKSVERLERIADDDRFAANREQVAAVLRGHLTYAIEVCQDLLDGFDTSPQED